MVAKGNPVQVADAIQEVGTRNQDLKDSEIAQFFANRNVLVTGGSGFLGKLLVEKLLRSCPNIKKLYMLIRAKKGKSPGARFKEHFEDALYDRLKKEQPRFVERVVMVEGDVGEKSLGLSDDNLKALLDIDIVFHSAATVNFHDTMRRSVNVNIRGTKQLLLFARNMINLKAFVHVSTAFSQCATIDIEEKFYKPPLDSDKLMELVDILDDDMLSRMAPILIKGCPNTYIFTKAVGEDVARRYGNGLPVCVVRPSIVTSTAQDPVPGWTNNLNGATGIVFGAAIGILRTLHCNSTNKADIVPADFVINGIIAAAWDIAESKDKNANTVITTTETADSRVDEPLIYNCVSSPRNPITWAEFMEKNEVNLFPIPSISIMWYYCFTLNSYWWMNTIYTFFLHLIPAVIVDSLAYITGRQPMLLTTYKKIHKFSDVISHFANNEWRFSDNNFANLWWKLSPIDQDIFFFNIKNLNWDEYFFNHASGMRTYLFKDVPSTLTSARVKLTRLKIAHYTIMGLMLILVALLFTYLLSYFISWYPAQTIDHELW
ncbi:fatty acyl-CoA reductase wat [Orussus abietinus]|uniref:fatty acyl-CoA reductase wat n=1 Tax=Orussus abietinus TaxID=222816 RepID=UPI00062551AD|nr:fatty acyl-CoA reductase wat [Orussus abietinus]